jgi:hypothetical protein
LILFWIAFVGALAVILLGVDFYFHLIGRATLSRTIHDAAKKHPIITFVFGAVVGFLMWHFFVQNYC